MSALSPRRPLAQAAVAVLTACTATALTVLPAAAHVNDASGPVPAVGASGPAAHGAFLPASHASAPRLAVAQGADSYLPVRYNCSTNLRIKAQRLTSQQLRSTCTSLLGQDTYFHKVVKDGGNPVAGDKNTSLEVIVFDSKSEYQRLGGYYYGANTESGGEYMEGDPSASGNQARFITYRDGSAQSFTIKNLNHEYTHYLDGRYNMYGDWEANISTPTLWWIEGLAEYVSYGYLNKHNTWAAGVAPDQTYKLSALFDTTEDHDDQDRVYAWGYLAVKYMLENHPGDVTKILGYYRTGQWQAARTYIKNTIGTNYDAAFNNWLLT